MTQYEVPTLAHVAKLAGVSENTVSRVIRNKGPIAEDTRNRVVKAIETLGYVPNRAAGSLASSGSLLIGVLLPSLSNVVFPEVLQGIHAALATTAYQPMVGVTNYDAGKEQDILSSLLAWQPAAIVTTGFDHTEATRRMLSNSRVRVAELMDIDAEPIDVAVGLSHRQAGYATGRHLIERGYRRIGYVGHDWGADRRARLRHDGVCQALSETGLTLRAEERFDGPSSTMAGRDTLATLLARAPDIDAVVFSNDDMAVGGFFHCLAAGIVVRKQLALFGFNGLDIGQALPMPLSTVRSNRFLIGKTAVERLLESPTRPEQRVVIDTGFDIIEGATA
ncbi:LacI family DNA-binding transcriptional regulator [Rhizobium metallidurans]|uniref:LacI family gluconate utilization system Gnt-I transcriptional repressor n=1 Tax=Rhizobium metallidurans TaxID=1265931 RepID=A0A7W6GD91_9HYPH|nr:LacI family DNA-binding transcriptional regulator [Rhizobium metallidurans]MBB3965381.1 LacI family gluconate utilization system Gnt-I transcriptional repressor [Rhizobium metallidurans]